jgi:hypothetical protein
LGRMESKLDGKVKRRGGNLKIATRNGDLQIK